MSPEPSSRKPVAALVGSPTLADPLNIIAADEALTRRQRDDRASAIRTLAKATGRRPEEIPASPGRLQRLIMEVNPVSAGLTLRRWRNVLSLTRAALKQAGISTIPGRHTEPLSPAWADLYRYLNRVSWRIGLSRFAHNCSARGVDPSEVDDRVMAEYLETLMDHGLVSEPREVHRVTCLYWNRAAAAIPAWPKRFLSVPSYVRTYSLSWDDFPASLKAEADCYLHRLSGKDPLEELDFRPLRPSSLRSKAYQLRQHASALVLRGYDAASIRSLADLVAVEAVKEGLRFFLERSGGKSTKQIHDIACTLKAVARHWVRVPPDDLEKMRSICRRLDIGRGGMTLKNRTLLRQFDDDRNAGSFLWLSEALMDEAQRRAKPTLRDALLAQTALCVELLQMMPLRISNLARLDLDRHITLPKRPGGPMHVSIPRGEGKERYRYRSRVARADR